MDILEDDFAGFWMDLVGCLVVDWRKRVMVHHKGRKKKLRRFQAKSTSQILLDKESCNDSMANRLSGLLLSASQKISSSCVARDYINIAAEAGDDQRSELRFMVCILIFSDGGLCAADPNRTPFWRTYIKHEQS